MKKKLGNWKPEGTAHKHIHIICFFFFKVNKQEGIQKTHYNKKNIAILFGHKDSRHVTERG